MILFDNDDQSHTERYIKKCITDFSQAYTSTVREIISSTENGIDKNIFFPNVAKLMASFKMTRSGPFKGVRFENHRVYDPQGKVADCWAATGESLIEIKNFIGSKPESSNPRVLIELSDYDRNLVIANVWEIFKRLLPICMTENSLGLVGASKILFAVLPEITLPIDNIQWKKLFKTVDYGDVIKNMANEINEWENSTGYQLQHCDHSELTTLPAIYNVMAMKARPI